MSRPDESSYADPPHALPLPAVWPRPPGRSQEKSEVLFLWDPLRAGQGLRHRRAATRGSTGAGRREQSSRRCGKNGRAGHQEGIWVRTWSEETLFRESRIVFGRAEGHDVIRWRGEVLGFSERISWKGEGLLRLEGEALSFRPGGGSEGISVSPGRYSRSPDQLEGAAGHAGADAPVPVRSCWMTPRSAGRTFFASH